MTGQNSLAALIARHTPREGRNETAIAELRLSRASAPGMGVPNLYEPCLCLIAQGKKQIYCGAHIYPYAPGICLIIPMSLPLSGQVVEASAARPYLGLQISLNMAAITELLPHVPQAAAKAGANKAGSEIIAAAPTDGALPDAVLRLLRLLDAPQDIAALSGLILREIYYRLLRGSQGAYLAHMAQPEGHAARITKAISLIKDRPSEPLKVSALAEQTGMSISSFHAYFKQITGFSPLQYQKHWRLMQARRRLSTHSAGIAEIAYQLGWQSASQFSREYARLFGAPPKGIRQEDNNIEINALQIRTQPSD